jgi:hypothetical protein
VYLQRSVGWTNPLGLTGLLSNGQIMHAMVSFDFAAALAFLSVDGFAIVLHREHVCLNVIPMNQNTISIQSFYAVQQEIGAVLLDASDRVL